MKKVLSLMLCVCMILSIVPAVTFAADTTLSAVRTAVFNSADVWAYSDTSAGSDNILAASDGSDGWQAYSSFTDTDGTVTSQTSLSGTGFTTPRNSVISFTLPEDIDPDTIVKATLGMTVKNVKQVTSGVRIAVYGNSIDGTWDLSSGKGVFGASSASGLDALPKLGLTTAIQTGNQKGESASGETITLSSKTLVNYIRQMITEGKTEVTLRIATPLGGIRIYSYDTANPPTLALTYGEETSASLKFIDTSSDSCFKEVELSNLYVGDILEITEDIAPKVIDTGDYYLVRDDAEPVTLKSGANTINIEYNKFSIESANTDFEVLPVIEGGNVALPSVISATTTDGSEVSVPVEWTKVSEGKYEADLYDITVTKDINVLSCDSQLSTFTSSGESSDGASFSSYNDIKLSVGAGTVILDTAFTMTDGTNKLIMYGDSSTTAFGGAAALTRMFVNQANGAYVFEYYDSNTTEGWTASSVPCEHGINYLLRTEINMTNKTYNLYISANGESFVKLNPSPAAFRSSAVSTIDRMFFSGTMEMTSFRSHWFDGYSMITVSPVDEKGNLVADEYTLKCTTNSTYTATYLPKLLENGGKLYIMEDVNYAPSIKVTGDTTLNVRYNEVTLASYDDIVTVLVQGDSTINLPANVKLTFSDDQVVTSYITWDTSSVKKDTVGEYTATGTIEGLEETTIEATVKVREVTNLPKTTENTVATNNGGWNWYVEPSGTHIQPGDALATRYESGQYSSNNGYTFQHDKTYMGWVEDEGTIVVAEYDHDNDTYKRVELHPFLESDDHNNPAVVVLPDGRIMVFYSMHTNEPYMYYCVTKNPEDISEWNPWQRYYCYTEADNRTYNATYPSVFIVHDDEGIIGNDVIYVGWRGVHWKPTFAKFSIPDENGVCEMVMKQTQFANTTYGYSTYNSKNDAPNAKEDGGYTDDGRRPYTKYDYDFERNKIYITFTANHPDNDKRNHIYYIYLDIEDQNLYTAKDNFLQPLPKENDASYKSQGAAGTNGQWGLVTVDLVDDYPELLVFNASEQTGQSFNPRYGDAERRGWTWDIKVNEKGEPCIVYVDVTATPPGEDGSLPTKYLAAVDGNSRSHHYYWYARWDSDTQQWVKTFLTYGGKWFHENATQERCYSGGLTFDHNAQDANVIYLAIPTMGEYGNVFEIYRWESEDHGATWTIREPLTENSKINNARPNAIYNYKMDEDGNHAGPRLLWISGEYRYWMNYEYKTGVMTDWAADGFVTQDSPEMFADAFLYADDEQVTTLPIGEDINLIGQFRLTNISIGDGQVYLALAHYSSDGILKNVSTLDATVPARSVPQIGMVGAPKMQDGSLSPLGDAEIVEEIEYTADIEEGDKVKLFAWNAGVEHAMSSIISIPFDTTTESNKYAHYETFNYDGTEKLILDESLDTFNGWIGKAYGSNSASIGTRNYAAITKAPFGNTGLHLYHVPNINGTGSGGIMASHALPDTDGKDYRIRFTMRYINEMSWNDTHNGGFTLSHGVPVYNDGDATPCALQFRQDVTWREENGRGTSGRVRNTRWFDGGSSSEIFFETDGPDGVGFKHDALMAGSLYTVEVNVHPSDKKIDFSINDGHRTFYVTRDYVDASSFDWDSNPIDTITFSLSISANDADGDGDDENGEIYIDNYSVEIIE